MKTVPTLQLVSSGEVAEIAGSGQLPGLPEEVRLVLAEVASVAREGLLAMSVAAGLP